MMNKSNKKYVLFSKGLNTFYNELNNPTENINEAKVFDTIGDAMKIAVKLNEKYLYKNKKNVFQLYPI